MATQDGNPICKKKRTKKQPSSRVKLITGYIIYASEIRKEIIKKHPDKDFGGISKIVGSEWRNLPQETKVTYEKRAQEQNNLSRELFANEPLNKLADVAAARAAEAEGLQSIGAGSIKVDSSSQQVLQPRPQLGPPLPPPPPPPSQALQSHQLQLQLQQQQQQHKHVDSSHQQEQDSTNSSIKTDDSNDMDSNNNSVNNDGNTSNTNNSSNITTNIISNNANNSHTANNEDHVVQLQHAGDAHTLAQHQQLLPPQTYFQQHPQQPPQANYTAYMPPNPYCQYCYPSAFNY